MHTDCRELESGSVIKTDLCVIGAGAAGITIAREFVGSEVDVVLLESGGFSYDDQSQNLDRIEDIGPVRYPHMATPTSRVRRFGGTTNHWGGMSRPLDPIDFEVRSWVPDSGWPIGLEDLGPYYERANEVSGAGPVRYDDLPYWEIASEGRIRLPLLPDIAETKIYQYASIKRFGPAYREHLTGASNVNVVTNAVVTQLETDENANRVSKVRIVTFGGSEVFVEASQFVLACGAMENARLLLASNTTAPNGIGNDNDIVGRYFGEHPHVYAATLRPRTRRIAAFLYGHFSVDGTTARGLLHLSPQFQKRKEVLGVGAALYPWKQRAFRAAKDLMSGVMGKGSRNAMRDNLAWILGDLGGLATAIVDSYRGFTPIVYDPPRFYSMRYPLRLFLKLEQQPDPTSRIVLSDERNELGMRIPRLEWRLSDLDWRSLQIAAHAFADEFERIGLASVELEETLKSPDLAWPSMEVYGHHIGTTRMGDDPRHSVVDRHCRIHGTPNLFVAGSSVFPTGGCVNPTLTILALGIRIADAIKSERKAYRPATAVVGAEEG